MKSQQVTLCTAQNVTRKIKYMLKIFHMGSYRCCHNRYNSALSPKEFQSYHYRIEPFNLGKQRVTPRISSIYISFSNIKALSFFNNPNLEFWRRLCMIYLFILKSSYELTLLISTNQRETTKIPFQELWGKFSRI